MSQRPHQPPAPAPSSPTPAFTPTPTLRQHAIHLSTDTKVHVPETVANLEGPIVIHLGQDFILHMDEQQAADLIDQLSLNLSNRADTYEITELGEALLAQTAPN